MLSLQINTKTLGLIAGLALLNAALLAAVPGSPASHTVIVQNSDQTSVESAVQAVAGPITHEHGITSAGFLWSDALAESVAISSWVPQE